tara:strand:- start:117 stop:2033 length:1917 start_codon:yes stop_codon:yes gene_type:complete
MSVQRFTGSNNREAMGRVRAALGNDALILANRSTADGVEILAVADDAPPEATTKAPPAAPARPARQHPGGGDAGEQLLREVRQLRARLERAEAGPDSAIAGLERRLAGAGFGAEIRDDLLAGWPEEARPGDAEAWLRRQLGRRLPVGDGLDQGGVVVLLGPAGVGKTSLALKLAHRYGGRTRLFAEDEPAPAQRRAAEALGLIWEPLDLEQGSVFAGDGLAIVDTRGRGLRDPDLGAVLRRLGAAARPLLLLPAGAGVDSLEETVAVYQGLARAAGAPLGDAVIARRDDGGALGPLLDVALRRDLRLHYISTGQHPEDLREARPEALVEDALAATESTPAQVGDRRWADRLLDQSRALDAATRLLRDGVPAFRGLLDEGADDGLSILAPEVMVHGAVDATLRLALDASGLPLGPTRAEGDGGRLLPALPDAAFWHRLGDRHWLATARSNARVWHHHERCSLELCQGRAQAWDSRLLRHRGRPVQVRLRRLEVAAPLAGGGEAPLSARLCAWFGTLHDLDSGVLVGRRYWLAPAGQDRDRSQALLLASLSAEALPALERRARQALEEEGVAAPEAAGLLAALALRLDLDDSDWALDARGQLLALLGGRRRRKPETLLDGLLALLRARHSLRALGRDLAP